MKKNVMRVIAGTLAGMAVLTGCGKGVSDAPQGSSAAVAESSDEIKTTYGDKIYDNVTINVELFDRSNAPEGVNLTDNRWTQYVNQEMEKVGIHVNFVAIPRSEETTKVQVMMASGTAPDLIFSYDGSMIEGYYDDGGTWDLSAYVDGDGQAQNFKNYVTEEVIDYCRNSDGALWGLTAKRTSASKNNLFIRTDWLEALDMEMPTTTDELVEVLRAFRDNNPEGRTDVIPLYPWGIGVAQPSILALPFMESTKSEAEFESDSFCTVYSDEGYVEYLRWLNQLYNEGLMDPEYYTLNQEEILVRGRLGFTEWGVYDNVNYNRLDNLRSNVPGAKVEAMPALISNVDGNQYTNADPKNGMFIAVPKTCEHPDAVVTYLDWLASKDGGYVLYNGFEGEHYNLEDGIPVPIDNEFNDTDKNWLRMDLILMGNPGYYESKEQMIKTLAHDMGENGQYVIDDYAVADTGIVRSLSTYVSPTQAANYTEIFTVMQENQVKCITCAPADFDSAIASYKDALQKCGMDDVVKERNEHFGVE